MSYRIRIGDILEDIYFHEYITILEINKNIIKVKYLRSGFSNQVSYNILDYYKILSKKEQKKIKAKFL